MHLKHILRQVEPDRGNLDMTDLLCGSSQTHLGTEMPSGGRSHHHSGGEAQDRLVGRAGNVTLPGGAGRDRMPGGGRDRVTDLTLRDRIVRVATLWTGSVAGFVASHAAAHGPRDLRMATAATDVVAFDTTLSAANLTCLIPST